MVCVRRATRANGSNPIILNVQIKISNCMPISCQFFFSFSFTPAILFPFVGFFNALPSAQSNQIYLLGSKCLQKCCVPFRRCAFNLRFSLLHWNGLILAKFIYNYTFVHWNYIIPKIWKLFPCHLNGRIIVFVSGDELETTHFSFLVSNSSRLF